MVIFSLQTDSEQEDYRPVDKNKDHSKAKRRHNDIVVEYRRGRFTGPTHLGNLQIFHQTVFKLTRF